MKERSSDPLELDETTGAAVWRQVGEAIENYRRRLESLPVAPSSDPEPSRELLRKVDFSKPESPEEALALVVEGLTHHQVHNGHPRYFGLFNPATTSMSVAADALVAAFNPQLAAWTHAPFPCEVERLLLRALGERFGYPPDLIAGSFTTGGAEANHSALAAALVESFPEFGERGVRGLPGDPVLYVSSESHHSFAKAARLSGLGARAVRSVPVDERFVMDPEALRHAIASDRARGDLPFLVVATLGTTGAGLIDPVAPIADVASEAGIWLHADAAWGGAAALVPELRHLFRGIERADSITFDAHKWLAVPMGAGMFFTRHPDVLEKAFAVSAAYMPRTREDLDIVEPHRTSMQWTRRFIGLKLFLSLAVAGFSGYERTIRGMVELGERLREKLRASGFRVVNHTPLPVVCFHDARRPDGDSPHYLESVVDAIVESGTAWVSLARLGGRLPAIRACITNFRTRDTDLDALIDALSRARERF